MISYFKIVYSYHLVFYLLISKMNLRLYLFLSLKYLYLNYKKLSYRLGEYDSSKNLREVWYNLLFLKNNIFKTLIAPDKYLATKNYLGYSPKIVSYNSGKLEIEIDSLYNEIQFHFLINFF